MGLKNKIKNILKSNTIITCPITVIDEPMKLKDKRIIITGGASGIGRATAILATQFGAKVIILGRNEKKLNLTAKVIGCEYLQWDITKNINEDFFVKCEEKLGAPIDCLVNNAGVYVDYNSLNYTEKDFEFIFDTNVKGPFLMTQVFIKYCLGRKKTGNIVFTTSNRSLMGDDGPYGMSKSAINNFIQGLARENIIKGIRVNGVAPGMVASDINGIDPNGNMYTTASNCKRVIRAEEIANVITYLLSDESKCITGAIIPCDCGDRLR